MANKTIDAFVRKPGKRRLLYHGIKRRRAGCETVKKDSRKAKERHDLKAYTLRESVALRYTHKLSERRHPLGNRSPKSGRGVSPPANVADLTASTLWGIVNRERSITVRVKALIGLMDREDQVTSLRSFVVDQLGQDDLKPTWRNTLIFATEHLDFLDADQRVWLRERLPTLVARLNAEWHPRSRLAQEAALRRYSSLIDGKAQLAEMARFLSTSYPLRVRLIALQAIQNAFAAAPPSASLRRDLEPLRDELRRMVDFFFRPETLARSEEDFDLGLTALEALIRLDDPMISKFVPRVKGIGRRWVAKQLAQFLAETRATWLAPESASSPESVSAVSEALDSLNSIETQSD